ncbi:DHH family phosphohydrolase [Planoprotostelium fungivorum]|uniref:DHH family phosphohydrolase n=1 Tax=Planoprotostelium fungivorum TaxID=1890364 RepID=A0A2P6NFH1_9EUKA|nr:DHH family phosphohydrolase [Planoprotostelium fungivorum]
MPKGAGTYPVLNEEWPTLGAQTSSPPLLPVKGKTPPAVKSNLKLAKDAPVFVPRGLPPQLEALSIEERGEKRTPALEFWSHHNHIYQWQRKGDQGDTYQCSQIAERQTSLSNLKMNSCFRCGKSRPISADLIVQSITCAICGLCSDCAPASTKEDVPQMKHIILPTPSEVEVVLYHHECPDGTAAAFAAWKLLKKKNVTFYGAKRGDQPPRWVAGKIVAIFDFCYSLEETKFLLEKCRGLLIMDHHKSGMDELKHLSPNIYFDMERSGARLAWDYFHPNQAPPLFLKYIEDRDLWKWSMADSKAFGAYLDTVPCNYEEYDTFCDDSVMRGAVEKGRAILSYIEYNVSRSTRRGYLTDFLGYKVMVLNCTHLMNEIGNELALQPACDFALVWQYDHHSDKIIVSMRSSNMKVDLSEIARQFGGGGHTKAAAFRWSGTIQQLLKQVKKTK